MLTVEVLYNMDSSQTDRPLANYYMLVKGKKLDLSRKSGFSQWKVLAVWKQWMVLWYIEQSNTGHKLAYDVLSR